MASFRKRGPGRWEAQIRRRGWPEKTRTFPTKADAQAWAAEVEAAMRSGGQSDVSVLRSLRLHTLLHRYLENVTPKKKGAESEAYRLRALMRHPMAELTLDVICSSSAISDWRDARLSAVSGPAVKRDMNLLSHVFSVARKDWKIPVINPICEIRKPSENPHRTRIPAWSEKKRLLRALSVKAGQLDGIRNHWIRPLVTFALRTAMRRGELLALLWEDISFMERFAHVRTSKNGESRNVPLSRKALRLLSTLEKHPSGKVFPVSADAVKAAYKRATARAGVPDLRFHDLRHAATTDLARKLSNVLELSAVTGHKGLAMLKIYYQPRPSDLAEKLDALL